MNPTTGNDRSKLALGMAIVLAMSLLVAGNAWALYPPDGTKPNGPGAYRNPDDGVCVVGLAADGTMRVDWSITNARDCVAYTTGLTGMTGVDVTATYPSSTTCCTTGATGCTNLTNAAGVLFWSAFGQKCYDTSACTIAGAVNASCTAAGLPWACCTGAGTGTCANDGYKHAWSSSVCWDTANNKGISRVDLDNTDAMCVSKGGTVKYNGTCVAYGWQYLNRKTDGTLPITGSGVSTTPGVAFSDGLGFCSTTVRMTGGTYTSATCPSYHNSATTAPAEWPACLSSATGCQTQASYDAGLGWSYSSTGGGCRYQYAVKGPINAIAVKADGTTTALGTVVDLTDPAYDTMGECLAAGFTWDNWLPNVSTSVKTSADGGEYAGMPATAAIRRLDALTDVEDGGGDFYSGTGAVCQKCHSDQSRSYMERDKPGFPLTRHKLAGDATGEPFQPEFTAAGSDWKLQGVQCAMCHSTAKPAQDDLLQVNPAGATNAGLPKSASGHNNTEYGTHLIDLCYSCHGTAATPVTTNPASVIPVSGGEFALTSKGLEPITNQFLNSPHAKFTGTSTKVDVGDKTKYTSSFEGWVCRSAAGNLNRSYSSSSACTGAGYTWYTTTNFGGICYYNSTTCGGALAPTGVWTTTFSTAAYPWAADTGGPGGVCYGLGLGSIITTVYRDGEAEKIHNLDSTTNLACTGAGDGSSTSGAAGFWVRDGETSPGTPTTTDQGNCMTCHDVHWALADTNPEAEPLRRECTTCHMNSGASASGAPQMTLAHINHLSGPGTPLENWATDPNESCEACHMPPSTAGGSRMHLWRISTDGSYTTMGSGQANLAADGSYTDAAWVDIEHACGQCHDGSVPGNPVFSNDRLALVARGMHDSSGINCSVTFSTTVNVLAVNVFPTVNCGGASECTGGTNNGTACTSNAACTGGGTCNPIVPDYDWDWGDGSLHGTAQYDDHTYAGGGTKTIVMSVTDPFSGRMLGTLSRNVLITNPDLPPVIGGACLTGATWNANTWTMTLLDASSDDGPDADALADLNPNPSLRVIMDWGDGSGKSSATQGATFTHTYKSAGSFSLNETAIDSAVQGLSAACVTTATPAPFTIQATVKNASGSAVVPSATVQIKNAATGAIVKTTSTGATGQFSTGAVLKPAAYKVFITKVGYTFPVTTVSVGPSDTDFSRTINANFAPNPADDGVARPGTPGKRGTSLDRRN